MYSLDNKAKICKRYGICLFSLGFCAALLTALLITTLCLTNYKNYRYFEIIGGAFTAILAFLIILLTAKTLDLRRYKLHFESVLSEKERYIDAKVVSINEKTLTLDDNIRVHEVVLNHDGTKGVYYLLTLFSPSRLQTGKSYRFLLADRFIRGIDDEL